MLDSWKRTAAFSFLAPPLALRAERRYRAARTVTAASIGQVLPSLSIIIPARNEAENLQRLLPSLQAIIYPGQYEIIVVDDNSEDATAVVAQIHHARVLSLGSLTAGWYGKPNACHQGAQIAQGEWLLFTDADTVHHPEGVAHVIRYAADNGLDGLSLWLKQETRGLSDRLALTAAFAGLFAGLPPKHTHLNGQYILLRRDVYVTSNGFAAVRQEALEDVALGHHLKKGGYQVPILHGSRIAAVSMYANDRQMWHGLSRLSADSLRWSGLSSVLTVIFITALMSPLLTIAGVLGGRLRWPWIPVTWGTAVASIWPWSRRFGSGWLACFAPVGALFVQLAGIWGLINRVLGRGIPWKGRIV